MVKIMLTNITAYYFFLQRGVLISSLQLFKSRNTSHLLVILEKFSQEEGVKVNREKRSFTDGKSDGETSQKTLEFLQDL